MSVNSGSLGQLDARAGSIGKEIAKLKEGTHDTRQQMFRLARVGPGWVLGSIEAVSGMQHPGSHVAGKSFLVCPQRLVVRARPNILPFLVLVQ
jgi:hypothetical protein